MNKRRKKIKIGIIYPNDDYLAAQTVVNTIAFAGTVENVEFYMVPRDYAIPRYNKRRVYDNLLRCETCIFISGNKTVLDDYSKEEIEFVNKHNIDVYYLISDKISTSNNFRFLIDLYKTKSFIFKYSFMFGEIHFRFLKDILQEINSSIISKEASPQDNDAEAVHWAKVKRVTLVTIMLSFIVLLINNNYPEKY